MTRPRLTVAIRKEKGIESRLGPMSMICVSVTRLKLKGHNQILVALAIMAGNLHSSIDIAF